MNRRFPSSPIWVRSDVVIGIRARPHATLTGLPPRNFVWLVGVTTIATSASPTTEAMGGAVVSARFVAMLSPLGRRIGFARPGAFSP